MVIVGQSNRWERPFPAAAGLRGDRLNETRGANATLFYRER